MSNTQEIMTLKITDDEADVESNTEIDEEAQTMVSNSKKDDDKMIDDKLDNKEEEKKTWLQILPQILLFTIISCVVIYALYDFKHII